MRATTRAAAVGRAVAVTVWAGAAVSCVRPGLPEPAPAGAAYRPAISWGACRQPLQAANAECGFLPVPLDYAAPAGRKILLAVSRIHHTTPDARYQGVMLVNPGGPGGSGFTLSMLGARLPDHAGDAYDWVGFDPRGVGASQPSLSCDPDYTGPNRPDYAPTTPELERVWADRMQAYARACRTGARAAGAGPLLDHMTTVASARDMDSLRAALGATTLSYYGFSYGTYLGQVYATLYPQRVRRMVLDSNVDPGKIWYQADLDQNAGFERAIQAWFDWVARHDDVYHLGATAHDVEARWYLVRDGLRAAPAADVVGADEWTDMVMQAGYYQSSWPDLAHTFSRWVLARDEPLLIDRYLLTTSPGYDNTYAAYLAVKCTDAPWPTSWERWKSDGWASFASAPLLTWANTRFNGPCQYWTARAGQPVEVDGGQVPGILLISETLDAATPFGGSLEVRRRFPRASLIAEPGGTTHAGSLHGNACVDGLVARYLTDGSLPSRRPEDDADATCPPLPEPSPAAAAPSGMAATSLTRPDAPGDPAAALPGWR